MLPLTAKYLGKDFWWQFREFSQTYNPQTIKKHLEDAIAFCRFLQNANVSETVKSIAKFEQTRLNFFGYGKRFSLCFLKHDIRETLRNSKRKCRAEKSASS